MYRGSYRDFVMAVERVEQRLRRVTAALDEAGVPYAVIGGNAVAAWVARVDPGATRTTKDVDLLVDRADGPRVDAVFQSLRFERHDLRKLVLFVDPDEPSKRSGVHLVWAGERVRSNYLCPAPSVSEFVMDPQGFRVLDLPGLVRMKLTSFRDVDRVHVADLIGVGRIDEGIRAALLPELRSRLDSIHDSIESDDE